MASFFILDSTPEWRMKRFISFGTRLDVQAHLCVANIELCTTQNIHKLCLPLLCATFAKSSVLVVHRRSGT